MVNTIANIVNGADYCPLTVTVHDEFPLVNVEREELRKLLSDEEAQNSHLDVASYKAAVNELFVPRDKKQTIVSLAWMKDGNDKILAVSYVVRKFELGGRAIGPITISTAMEFAYQKAKKCSIAFWLQVAGYFRNRAAIQLYLENCFQFLSNYGRGGLLMCTQSFGEGSYKRICNATERKIESVFLLPLLKQRLAEQGSDEAAHSSRQFDDAQESQESMSVDSGVEHDDTAEAVSQTEAQKDIVTASLLLFANSCRSSKNHYR
ncbi:uncharacterized protein LOC116621159 [Nematostella vectensis]|uniref:uncharacterized protein LOC116621159 n=1 Tax=Nematostella vectensis TaxID=45351 RepID=UPI002076DF5F|nr:uncharacterized protein LOC116621159 [Nematostella vectensis]XP_048589880.1 uncharacterized protein LOC116621159 [Nematostella vectensis]XP_048589881.1 uncharacterized protein LOC116621159 [Nematostella vectensis]XP_048589882.1 uncharacterized protein LOC116621159 [Nematostella vectensis]